MRCVKKLVITVYHSKTNSRLFKFFDRYAALCQSIFTYETDHMCIIIDIML